MAWTFCTKEDVVAIHPGSKDALQDLWSNTVEFMIRKYKRNPNLGAVKDVTDELHDGTGQAILFVNQPPIAQVTELKVVTSGITDTGVVLTGAIPTDQFIFTGNMINLLYQVFPVGHLNIAVSYKSGTGIDQLTGLADVDPTVRFCAVVMLAAILDYRGRGGSDASIKFGTSEVKEGNRSPMADAGLVDHLYKIMRKTLTRDTIRMR